MPTPLLQHKTPYERLFGSPPSYTHLRVFGCLAFAATSHREKDKFSPRGIPCAFLGYSTQKGYKLLDLASHTVLVSRDVKFVEHVFPFHHFCRHSYMQPNPIPMLSHAYDDVISPTHTDNMDTQQPTSLPTQQPVPAAVNPSPPVAVRRSTRPVTQPRWMHDFVTAAVQSSHTSKLHYPVAPQVSYDHLHPHFQVFLSTLDAQQDPTSFPEAVQHQHWCDAMNVELQALEKNGTWLSLIHI